MRAEFIGGWPVAIFTRRNFGLYALVVLESTIGNALRVLNMRAEFSFDSARLAEPGDTTTDNSSRIAMLNPDAELLDHSAQARCMQSEFFCRLALVSAMTLQRSGDDVDLVGTQLLR